MLQTHLNSLFGFTILKVIFTNVKVDDVHIKCIINKQSINAVVDVNKR